MAFSEAQQQAITHGEGPMIVLAGPGSGKTTVITHRVKYLTEQYGADPGSILVITFTRAAALEMKERYGKLTGKPSRVTFGTFHSVFFRILKLAYNYSADNIVREEQQRQVIRELSERAGMEPEDVNEFTSQVLSEISMVKSERMSLRNYYSTSCPDEVFRGIYSGYDDWMRRAGLIDFDDMMVMCLELFQQRGDILAAWQRKYRYILIDEFQDINRLQYEIMRMLAGPEDNLFIVGDDDQSIYRFRGARPEIMLGFEKDYPTAKRVLLDVNYRCTDEIVTAALRLIDHNRKRFPKAIRSAGSHGRSVMTKVFEDPREEAAFLASAIGEYIRSGVPAKEIAVLYRTNSGPRTLMEALMVDNIPFRTRDRVPNLYDHWISQNIIAYIRMAMGDMSRSGFLRIMNRPKRYISRASLMSETVSWFDLKEYYKDKDWMIQKIEDLQYDLKAISRMSPLAAVNYIRQGVGYDSFLKEYAETRHARLEDLMETADELRDSAANYRTFEEWFNHMEAYREELRNQAQQGRLNTDAVTLATMHGAKGLEFQIVFILDANEGVVPHNKALLDDDIEEERRLFYVGMTRAKSRLTVCAVRERFKKPVEVSRFVADYGGMPEAMTGKGTAGGSAETPGSYRGIPGKSGNPGNAGSRLRTGKTGGGFPGRAASAADSGGEHFRARNGFGVRSDTYDGR